MNYKVFKSFAKLSIAIFLRPDWDDAINGVVKNRKVWNWVWTTYAFIVPVFVIVICYMKVLYKITQPNGVTWEDIKGSFTCCRRQSLEIIFRIII